MPPAGPSRKPVPATSPKIVDADSIPSDAETSAILTSGPALPDSQAMLFKR